MRVSRFLERKKSATSPRSFGEFADFASAAGVGCEAFALNGAG
jgi:hypothetical protein